TDGVDVTGIVDAQGRRENFSIVASNADVFHTYDRLLKREPLARPMSRRLAKMNYSMSLFLIYFGTRRKYPNLLHHNILFGPRNASGTPHGRGTAPCIFRPPRTPPAHRTPIWPRRVARPSMCFRRCRTWVSSTSTGASKDRGMPSAFLPISNATTCPTCVARSSRNGSSHHRIFKSS